MKSNYNYPLLEQITKVYEDKKDTYTNVYLLVCQHILEPQSKMFELISEFSIPKENIYIFGKIYSTSNEIYNELKDDGFNISQPSFNSQISFDQEHAQNCKNEFVQFLSKVKSPSKIIILDDGGSLLNVVQDSFELIPKDVSVVGIEQTSSGFRKLENANLNFPIFNVARSSIKLIKESPIIAYLGFKRIKEVFDLHNIQEPRVLVVGLGPIGSNTITALENENYFTLGYDIAHHDQIELHDLIKKNNINVIIGATGSTIVTDDEIIKIKEENTHNIYLISMSSADREFPTVYMRENGLSTNEIHSDVTWDNLILINNGFPLTFKGNRLESTEEEIERTIALLYGSVLESIVSDIKQKGFIEVPEKIINLL